MVGALLGHESSHERADRLTLLEAGTSSPPSTSPSGRIHVREVASGQDHFRLDCGFQLATGSATSCSSGCPRRRERIAGKRSRGKGARETAPAAAWRIRAENVSNSAPVSIR
jgi:hypothetical protein